MKRISKRILFIFMSILLAQSCHVQASAAAAVGKIALDAAKAATPIIEEATKAAAPIATGFFRTCGQKMGAAAMTHIVRPAFVLTRGLAVATLGAVGLYGGGKVLLEKGGAVPAPAAAAPKVAEASQGIFGNLLNGWDWKANTPKAVDAGKKVAEKAQDWGPWIASITGLNYMKSTRLGKLAIANPKWTKVILAYAAAGYAYIHIVKRIQLNNKYRTFLTGIQAAQNNQTGNQTWVNCQAELRAAGFPHATPIDAVNYIKDMKASGIDNGWAEWIVFPAHMAWSKFNDKILWIF